MRGRMIGVFTIMLTMLSFVANAQDFGGPFNNGVLTLDFSHIDDILKLQKNPEVAIVEITNSSRSTVSSAYLALLLRWIDNGGIRSKGFESSLFEKVNPGIKTYGAMIEKESGPLLSSSGELFVR